MVPFTPQNGSDTPPKLIHVFGRQYVLRTYPTSFGVLCDPYMIHVSPHLQGPSCRQIRPPTTREGRVVGENTTCGTLRAALPTTREANGRQSRVVVRLRFALFRFGVVRGADRARGSGYAQPDLCLTRAITGARRAAGRLPRACLS